MAEDSAADHGDDGDSADDADDAERTDARSDDGGDVAGRDPDAIAQEIEQTRAELAQTIDAIAARISPRRAASRGAQAVKAQVSSAREKVSGSPSADSSAEPPGDSSAASSGDSSAPFSGDSSAAYSGDSSSMPDGEATTPAGLVGAVADSSLPVGPIVAVAAAVVVIALLWRRRRSR